MNFKSVVAADWDTFLNNDEFAYFEIIDGVILKAILQNRTAEKSGRMSQNYDELHGDFVDVYFKTVDYCRKRERIPRHGEYVKIWDRYSKKRKRYEVLTAIDEMGITHLQLSAYRQNTLRGVRNDFDSY